MRQTILSVSDNNMIGLPAVNQLLMYIWSIMIGGCLGGSHAEQLEQGVRPN